MRSFKDANNRSWSVDVDYNAIVEVNARCGIDLRHLVDDHEHVAGALDNPAKLREVVGILTETQREKEGVDVQDLFRAIKTAEQSDAVVLAVYQATFDFFHSEGGVLNDALGRVERARKSALTHRRHQMKQEIDSGLMDRYLRIMFDPEQVAIYAQAATGPKAVKAIAEAWKQIVASGMPEANRIPALIRTCLTKNLDPASTPSTSASGSPGSSASTPDLSHGEN